MEEIKIKGLVINSIDYKEKDKLVCLFSLELGPINVIFRNCKSAKSKLKAITNPFCFADFELLKQGEIYIVKTANLIENFYDLAKNYNRYKIANYILEITKKCTKQNDNSSILFVNLLKCLNLLAFDDVDENLVLLKFVIGFIKVAGYKFNFKICNKCQNAFVKDIYLNLDSGEFECGSCKENYAVNIPIAVFNALYLISNTEVDNLKNIDLSQNVVKDAIKIMMLNLQNRFGVKINCVLE